MNRFFQIGLLLLLAFSARGAEPKTVTDLDPETLKKVKKLWAEKQAEMKRDAHVDLSVNCPPEKTPPHTKIAFIGDSNINHLSQKVFKLMRDEKVDAVVHSGDLDYQDQPMTWELFVNKHAGRKFPYFFSKGNHDKDWKGYRRIGTARLERLDMPWDGDYGLKSSLRYRGIFIMLGDAYHLRKELADYNTSVMEKDHSIWRVVSWHHCQKKMQVGDKNDQTGWEVYNSALEGGAIVATAHNHAYGRTYLMRGFEYPQIVQKPGPLNIGPGATFAFVSGLGGGNIKETSPTAGIQPWWAKVYNDKNEAKHGVLIGIFHYKGALNRARFYFKNISNEIIDEFEVRSLHRPEGLLGVVYPDGGEKLTEKSVRIRWNTTDTIDKVRLKVSSDGTDWTTIGTALAAARSFIWNPKEAGSNILVRVESLDGEVFDESDAPFTISSPVKKPVPVM